MIRQSEAFALPPRQAGGEIRWLSIPKTAGEMGEVTAFFRTPTGQKLLQKYPALMQDSMALGQTFGQAIAPELQNRIVDELRKRGHSI